ncbi:MAG: hypothetical protein QOE36_1331 [Gaiellaceae bacterium]|jgi:hypothetical protein|nr:hypothetical protein [Gaiellaceae bacterium]
MPRRLVGLAGLAGVALATAAYVRRSAGHRRERVDLYYDDGSMVSLPEGSPAAARLLALGRETLRAAR